MVEPNQYQNLENSPYSFQLWGNDNFTVIVQYIEALQHRFGKEAKEAVEQALAEYLKFIYTYINRLPIEYILDNPALNALRGINADYVPIPKVFTDLNVIAGRDKGVQRAVAAVANNNHIVVIGDPGSGKTTLTSYLSVLMALPRNEDNAVETLKEDDQGSWTDGLFYPVFVTLNDFATSEFFWLSAKGDFSDLVAYIVHAITKANQSIKMYIEQHVLAEILRQGKALIVLDGLDELPIFDSDPRGQERNVRERLKRILDNFVEMYPKCRVIVTSRSYAYEEDISPWRLSSRFSVAKLQEFSDDQIKRYVRYWYRQMSERANRAIREDNTRVYRHLIYTEDQIEDLVRNFWHVLTENEYMQRLARRPLILTFIVSLFDPMTGLLPSYSRVQLYEQIVLMLALRWSRMHSPNDRSLHDALKLQKDSDLIELLAVIAFEAQYQLDNVEIDTNSTFITEQVIRDAWLKFCDAYKKTVDVDDQTWSRLKERTGILLPDHVDEQTGQEIFKFAHGSFREWLAAIAITKENRKLLPIDYWPSTYTQSLSLDVSDLVAGLVEKSAERWREVITFVIEHTFDNRSEKAWDIVRRLTQGEIPTDPNDNRWYGALIAARFIFSLAQLDRTASIYGRDEVLSVVHWLAGDLKVGALSVKDREEIGKLLAEFGDIRICHSPSDPSGEHFWQTTKYELPTNLWVRVPRLSILVGSPERDEVARRIASEKRPPNATCKVNSFFVSKYHVTNWLYSQFINEGFDDRSYWNWSDECIEWRKRNGPYRGTEHDSNLLTAANLPRVYVCWYEAISFCKWLTSVLAPYNVEPYLLSEREWIAAAIGNNDNVYLWEGDEFIEYQQNTDECRLGHPVSVGIFKSNLWGIYDISGNVAEWTRTVWNQDLAQPEKIDLRGKQERTIRGNHFSVVQPRIGKRQGQRPDSRYEWLGFRIAAKIRKG